MAENTINTAVSGMTVTKAMSSPFTPEKRMNCENPPPANHKTNQGSPSVKHTDPMTPPAVTEKRTQTNVQASPSRQPASSNAQADVEGYMKTDDRMRLAKERREEREKSLAARELAIKEKERRAQLQYEKTVEERWKKLEEQRQKEELRRAAVEEKRRQQLEEEKERLEALMRRSLERSLQLENRNKRWAWGPNGATQGDWENTIPPLSAASALSHDPAVPSAAAIQSGNGMNPRWPILIITFLRSTVATCHDHPNTDSLNVNRLFTHTQSSLARCNSAVELQLSCLRCRVPSSPHRSPYRGSPSRRRNNLILTEESSGPLSAPNTPKKERLRGERRTGSPATGSPVRRAKSPVDVPQRSASPATPKLLPKGRTHSPSPLRQYPSSPVKHRLSDGWREEKQAEIGKNHQEAMSVKAEIHNKSNSNDSLERKPESDKSVALENPQRKNEMVETPVKKQAKSITSDVRSSKSAEASPINSPGKIVGERTDSEEASRLLAERRRLARVLKEHEEKQRKELEEHEKLKSEQKKRQLEEKGGENCKLEPHQRKTQKQEMELQAQVEEDKEDAEMQSLKLAERQQQERELSKQQEEQERQLRKKRIEEIMKRTRKSDGEMKRDESPDPISPVLHPISPPAGGNLTGLKPQGKPQQTNSVNEKKEISGKISESRCTNEQIKSPSLTSTHFKKPIMNNQGMINPTAAKTEEKVKLKEETIRTIKQDIDDRGTLSLNSKEELKSTTKKNVSSAEKTQEKNNNSANKPKVPTQSANTPSPNPHEHNGQGQTVAQLSKTDTVHPAKPPVVVHMNGQVTAEGSREDLIVRKADVRHVNGQGNQIVPVNQGTTVSQTAGHVMTQKERLPSSLSSLADSKAPMALLHLDKSSKPEQVHYMEVSPVSKEELISIPEFSPVISPQHNGINNLRALEDLLDLTGQIAYPRISPAANHGDCNKNLIEGVCSPGADGQLFSSSPPASNKHNIK
ncbi:hypothetical protein DNTS_012079 [Danionella cerebrum]|uniref:MAP7 domain-containing protein 2 n=1 Tax=Danionella cerebrum TaxID=2873325 RepID=A0A553PV33_9TELE|nr:hypothetical protein DNTS_012079 [Danionella translucida]